jgi:putative transposase
VDALRESPDEGWNILFEDESDIHWLPLLASSWTKKGVQLHVQTPGNSEKRYCFGAVDYHTGESYFRLSRRKDSATFVLFLKQLMNQTSKKFIIVLDNYSIHKTKAVRDFVEQHADRLKLVFLPTYSPWLNPIELFWRQLKRRVLANRFFESIVAQLRELWKRLKVLMADGIQVRQIIGANAT